MLVLMLQSWNQFNVTKRINFKCDESEFSRGHWSLEILLNGVVPSEFFLFFLPALSAHGCLWFLSGIQNQIVLHVQ